MFDYRLKDIFKTYVDSDKFIFAKINNGGIETKFVRDFDWFNVNSNTIYFCLDDVEPVNNEWFYAEFDIPCDYNGITNIFYRFLSIKWSGVQYRLRMYRTSKSGSYAVFGDVKYATDVITIDGKQYLSFDWDDNNFSKVLFYDIGQNYFISDDIVVKDNIGYHKYVTENVYSWYDNSLDFDYLYSHSGDKLISPLVYKLLEDDKTITETNLNKIVEIVKTRYLDKWNKLYQALVVTPYNPIENYSMVEVETPNITKSYHREQSVNLEVKDDGENNSSVYAFNSSSAQPSGKVELDNTRTTSGDVDDNYQDGNDTETGTREKTRSGNIGVTTTQQMLEQEIEIKKHNFYDIVYEDVDNIIALDIY